MRRHDREITDRREILDIMRRAKVVRLAFNDEPVPYILPLNFGLEATDTDIILWMHGAMEGRKYDFLGQEAAFEMDIENGYLYAASRKSCTMPYESVIGRGLFEEVTEEQEILKGLDVLIRHAHPEGREYQTAMVKVTRVFRLRVISCTAKRRGLKP
ncbi:pyridoxamine 5'-phosphate oxidase family protein [Faecalibaculum rodentium]|uniref:pyridoxamine 5'-phosphate oxidase family protein n=1 Tax=Faecalibaculum rodentium TaxID=1702221 RepID=UPI0023F099AE|nr:pyridoxamine 5'-phosphate oxidase family protein [Faecalibaculum rodentium]